MGRTYNQGRGEGEGRFQRSCPRHQRSEKPHSKTNVVATREVEANSKRFVLRGISNQRGKALEVREISHGRENLIVIPMDAVDGLLDAAEEVMGELEAVQDAQ